MILRQYERITRAKFLTKVIVATSADSTDDELTSLLQSNAIEVRRGPLEDVFARFGDVISEFEPDHIVRLTADCPLIDYEVIDRTVKEHLETDSDYTTNTTPPTFPDGLDVEVFTLRAFKKLRVEALSTLEREHVTLGFKDKSRGFNIHTVSQTPSHGHLRWTVDLPEDLEFVKTIYERLYVSKPGFIQNDILQLLRCEPNLSRTENDEPRNSGLLEQLKRADNHLE